jgi:hypothetical protein
VSTIAYCAGFFDGEGCISLEEVRPSVAWCAKHRVNREVYREHRLRCITVQKYDAAPLALLEKTFGGRVHNFADGQARHIINGHEAVAMLAEMLPWLTVKRDQAAVSVRFFDMTRADRAAAVHQLRAMKRHNKRSSAMSQSITALGA